jgi:hypothetical protein
MKRFHWGMIGAGLVVATCGCAGNPWNFFHPGQAPEQQRRAERFDPYPENDIGPPLTGTRPREFDRPSEGAARAHWDALNPPVCPPQPCPRPAAAVAPVAPVAPYPQ